MEHQSGFLSSNLSTRSSAKAGDKAGDKTAGKTTHKEKTFKTTNTLLCLLIALLAISTALMPAPVLSQANHSKLDGTSVHPGSPSSSMPPTIIIAVASNFHSTLSTLLQAFEESMGTPAHSIKVISGSSGHLYHQIRKQSPIDLFLSANEMYIDKLVASGLADTALSPFVYATGRLVLWHPNQHSTPTFYPNANSKSISNLNPSAANHPADTGPHLDLLYFRAKISTAHRVAIAHTTLAPYGVASKALLTKINRQNDKETTSLDYQLIKGNNVAQVYSWVKLRHADMGFVPYAYMLLNQIPTDQYTLIPTTLHPEIGQKLIVLNQRKHDVIDARKAQHTNQGHAHRTYPTASSSGKTRIIEAFYHFLQSPTGYAIIQGAGYHVDDTSTVSLKQ